MLKIRRSEERGHANHGWLDSYHTFSFADYYHPEHDHFRTLRVINEDRVQPREGFPTHSHADMEIVTYVLEGALAHKDSMGNASTILPGEVQRMSAGTGVSHSEYNASDREVVHLLQIWIFPDKKGLQPGYEQRKFSDEEKRGTWRLVASRDGHSGSVTIHQDARIYAALLGGNETLTYDNPENRHAWIHVARGLVRVNDAELRAGDALAVDTKQSLTFTEGKSAELLLFDLA